MSDSNIRIDSGILNSNRDLGINMAPKDQFSIRFVNHCAPIVVKGYIQVYNKTDNQKTVMRYHYGRIDNASFIYEALIQTPDYPLDENNHFRVMTSGRERPEYGIG